MKNFKTAAKTIILILSLTLAVHGGGVFGSSDRDSVKLQFDFTPEQFDAVLKSGKPTVIFFNKEGKNTEVISGFDSREKLEKTL